MKNFKKISKTLHYIMHPNIQQDNISQMLLFFCLINKAQELEMLKNSDSSNLDQNMISIYSLIQYASVVNALTVDQHIGLIIGIFIFSIVLLIAIAVQFLQKAYSSKIIIICNQFIMFFILLFLIPSTYATFKFMLQDHICNESYLCTSSNRIGFSIMAIINFITALLITLIHLYYGKCDKLMGDSIILIMNHRFPEQILVKTLTLTTVIFFSLELNNYLRFACLTIKWCICGYQSLLRINQFNYVILDIMAFSIGIAISFNLSIYEPFLIFSMLLLLILQLKNRINGWYVTVDQQDNLITIQILECANKLEASMQFRLFRIVISNNHVCKKNCKSINSMIECLLKKLANDSKAKEQYILIYCDYIANHAPLKGLLRLLLHNSSNQYFQSASNNLIYQLYNRSQQQQKEAKMKNQVRNSNDHSTNLDIVSAYQTFHSANILFPSFIETLNYKIDFWTKLINGYGDIQNCINKTYETTQQITKCKQVVEERFDLDQCKLKISPSADLLTMRILQIYYTGIYQNSYQAYTLERNFEDLLKSERFKQDEILDNIQLVQNRLFIFKTSLVNKRGELIKLNFKQLSQFLNDTEDSVRGIVHISQLMPEFLASIHDNLMDNYMQNGYSKLMIHGEQSYFLNTKGYLEPCIVNLFNFYDNNNDFILNMILTKEASNSDIILFGVDGKILGITEQLHQSLNDDRQNINQREQSKDLLKKGSLIQYFIPDITNYVNDLRLQILNSSNYQLSNLKGIWTFPENHTECIRTSATILNKFSRKTKSNSSNYRSYKSQTYSKYTFSSINSELLEYDEGKIPEELREQIMIDKSPIIMLHPQFKEVLEQYYEQFSKNQKQLSVVFNIQFRKLKYKNGQFIYFILNIKETNKVNLNKSFQLSQIESTQFRDNAVSEQPQSEKIGVQFIKSTNLFVPYMQVGDSSLEASKLNMREQSQQILMMPSSDRPHIFETNRYQANQGLTILPKQLEYNTIRQEVDQLELEMEDLQAGKKDFEYPALEEEEQIDEAGKRNSVSQSKEKQSKSNILEKFVKGKQMNAENAIDFASNPSKTSTNSTSKESLLIVQQLYHNTALITPLKKISLILFLVTSGILISSILNIQLINSNLQEQTNEVNNLRQPADINYFYCSALFQMWAFQLNEKQILNLSPYLYQKNKDVLASMFEFSRASMFDLSILVPIQAQKLGFEQFIITQIIDKQKIFSNITYLEFYQILYEQVELAYRQNLGNDTKDFSALYSDQFIRQNIIQIIGFHQDLILSITNDTISRQGGVKTYFLTILFFELFSIVLCIGLQLKIWLSLDEVVKKIIFLVARLNETQAIEQINKLNLIKSLLEDEYSNRWKLFNFGEIVFEQQDSKNKIATIPTNVKQNNYKVSIALYSRIQITKYFKKLNVIITFIFAIIWTIFLMSGYLLHMQNNDDFQPSLVVALKFLQYRHNFDSSVFIGGLIKSELLLPLNEAEYINQTETVDQFMRFRVNLQPILNEVMDVILQKAERNGVVSRFDGILSQDLCNQFSENLDMCHPSTLKLEYYQRDDYLNVIRTGVLGMTAMFDKFISQEFDFELDQILYQSNTNNLKIVGSQSYQNLFVQYFTDIQDTLRMFLLLFQYDNQSISDGIIQIVTIYYLGFGVSLYLLICLTSIIWVYKAQKYINSTQQILVLIPLDQILNPNIRSQAKEIHSNLY